MASKVQWRGRRLIFGAAPTAIFGLFLVLGGMPGSLPFVWGAESDAEQAQQKTRRVPAIGNATFEKLARAQEFFDAEPKDLDAAVDMLNGMLQRSRRYNGNEIGNIHNMLGFIYFTKEDYDLAISHYEKVIAQGEEIPEGLETTTLYTLAQLCFVTERFRDSLRYMQTWIDKAQNPGPTPHIFMGQVYYQMVDYPNAVGQIERGIAIAKERGTKVKENWWALLNYLYFEQENYPKVLETLEILVRDFPKREYWIRLAGMLNQLGRDEEQVYAMMAAHEAGFFSRESDYVALAGLLMQENVPIRAANVMQEGFDAEVIKRTDRNLRSLGQAYQLAQETSEAIPILEEAAEASEDGRIYESLSQLYLQDDQFGACVVAASNAVEKGGLRKVQSTYVVRGMCEYNRDRLSQARSSFVSCRNESRRERDDSNQRVCQQWISFIDKETRRRQKLKDAI